MAWANRADVEDFLFYEAELLDEWDLETWLSLWIEDGRYIVPATDADPSEGLRLDPQRALCLITDDIRVLRSRVRRLLDQRAHVENPHSRTRHMISNVRVVHAEGDEAVVRSCFVVYRCRIGRVDSYMGRYQHHLVRADGSSFRIRERRAVLDIESLSPMGTISFIL